MITSQVPLSERSIRYIKGVGPGRLRQLAQVGIQTLEDACYYPPRRYEDRTRVAMIAELHPGELATIRGKILSVRARRIRRGQTLVEVALGDGSGVCNALWFHQPYLAQQFTVGQEWWLYGHVEAGGRRSMIHPELEPVEEAQEDASLHVGRIVPIYPLSKGISQRWLRSVIATVLEPHSDALEESLPDSIRQAKHWPGIGEAIRQLHFPTSWETLAQAQERLVFDELLVIQLALAQRRAHTLGLTKPQHYHTEGALVSQLRAQLPFALTRSQEQVIEELFADLMREAPMHRLLQGDVGCGKTMVMMFLIALVVQSGYQAVVMAPTELLAEQHARVVKRFLEPLGVKTGLVSQGVAAPARKQVLAQIADGSIQVVIGTHALIERPVTFRQLALVVIDEQHKFGVMQRAQLARKAQVPDVLVMTATPIPRTLALSLYGDLDISTITELPPGRQPVSTQWMSQTQREALYAMIRQQLAQGRQGYVVYPLVEEGADATLKAAVQMAKHLQADVFPEMNVGLLHGQMKPQEKERTMQAFVRGSLHLLVSTVIVEVGLDVPNATIMVIEHPERFGLAQLHQLRGRIGRGAHAATCIVVSDSTEESLSKRLEAFVQYRDGFSLAEQDLALRGPGQLLGHAQHGWWRLRLADLTRHGAILEAARKEALTLIAHDPQLRDPEVSELRRRLGRLREGAS